MPQTTFVYKPEQARSERRRHVVDARSDSLGRVATKVATLLRGRHKPVYTNFVDCGDFVEVTHASELKLTGKKLEQKFYFSHSGYAGGARVTPIKAVLEKDSRKVVYLAVKRMIPVNRLRARQLARLKIYKGERKD